MNQLYRLLLIFSILTFFATKKVSAQCVIDSSQTQPGVHPDSLINGNVNQFYSQDITFVMITDTLGLNISNFQLVAINGLPLGMLWTCDHAANGCNYNPSQTLYGCVRIYGTPLVANAYTLSITVVATVAIIGNQTFNFNTQLVIEPAIVSNTGFTMTNSSGCAPLTVNLTNNLPGLPYYNWNFGNGNTSLAENPLAVTYSTAGDYLIQQTSISDTVPKFYLTSVKVDSIPDNAGFLDSPDMYIIIKNQGGATVYDSHPSISNTPAPVTFSIPSLQLNNENYSVFVWDEDSGLTAPDDPLGNILFAGNGLSGIAYATVSGASGKLKLVYTIQEVPPVQTIAIDTVHVYPAVLPPLISFTGTLIFCDGDSGLVTSNNSAGNQWYKNGNLLVGQTNQTLILTEGGIYFDVVTNSFGCSDTSSAFSVTFNLPPPYPNFAINGSSLTANVPGTYVYQWFLNDTLLAGATMSSYTALISGNYQLQLTDTNGCSRKSFPISVIVTGIYAVPSDTEITIYPNPAKTELNIALEITISDYLDIKISDLIGKTIFADRIETQSKSNYHKKINVANWSKGIYFAEIKSESANYVRKIVIE